MPLIPFVLGVVLAATGAPAESPADLIVINAQVWTADPDHPAAEALAVRDGRFVLVGSNEEANSLRGDATRIIDAQGRRVLPGLIDTHIHLAGAADDFQHLYLREARSREHLLEMIREHAATLAPDDWLIGVRWTAESWPDQRHPNADEIDDAADGRRAVLIRMDGHMLLASRAALEYSGITRESPADPPGGKIGRGADGTPDGGVYEQAMALVRSRLPDDAESDLFDRFRRAVREINRVGITQVGAIESQWTIESVLARMDEAGDLTLRIAATVRAGNDRDRHWNSMLQWAAANPRPSPRVRVIGFKGFMDGTLGSRTAWMMSPYLDDEDNPANEGFPLALAGSGHLGELIQRGAAMGLQPAVHAIGERANHELLNWYEAIPADQRAKLRPRIEHAQHVLPTDIERFASLGVVASMQPLHKADDGRYAEQRIGAERLRTSYAFRDLIDSGAILAFGSDWPVVSPNPWHGIHAAVSSRTLDGKTFLPEQAITIEEALVAYTREAARCLLSERETGMIRPGFAADFIIIDRDVLTIEIEEVRATAVMTTVIGGRVVHGAD